MKKRHGGQIAVMLVCMILGIMLATQFKNVQKVGGNVSLQRAQELSSEIQKLNQDINSQKEFINELEQRVKDYENAAQDEGKLSDTMYKELERARMLAGLETIEGAGVIVTVDVRPVTGWDNGTQIVRNVYYDDLLMLVNELNAAGAEAVSINDERIIASTEIRNAGDYIVINTNRYSAPFEIKAVGNPETLEASLKLLGGVADTLGQELQIKIQLENNIDIPKYNGQFQFNYAVPVQ